MRRNLMLLDSEAVKDACLDVARGQMRLGIVEHIEESVAFQAAAVIGALLELCDELAAGDEAEEIEMEIPERGTEH